jgi:hypothetical protein
MQASSPFRRLGAAFISVSGVPAICIGGPTTGSNEKEWTWKRGCQSGCIRDSPTVRVSLRIPTERFSDRWLNVEINWQPGVPAGVEKRSIRPKDFDSVPTHCRIRRCPGQRLHHISTSPRTNSQARNHERRLVTREVYKWRGLATLPELHALVA